MKAFWFPGTNVGDTLTPVLLEHFTPYRAEWVPHDGVGKLLMCGSILENVRPWDTVLGAGTYQKEPHDLEGVRVLALRGKKSGAADHYGDPALLLPLMFKPRVKKTRAVGYIPHVWDQQNYSEFIDVNLPWKQFVREVLSCEKVISSSLHGIIIANAYGVSAEWIHYPKIPGAAIKYSDYISGIENGIEYAQEGLLKAMAEL